jgi:hypothetical protein
MIELKVIQSLVVHIKSELVKQGLVNNVPKESAEAVYNQYLMEYSWALLMNLCLHDESRAPVLTVATDILTCVMQMLLSSPTRDVGLKSPSSPIPHYLSNMD